MEEKPVNKPFEEELEKELYKEKPSARIGRTKKIFGVKKKEPFKEEFWQETAEKPRGAFHLKKFFWLTFFLFIASIVVFAFVIYYRAIQITGVNLNIIGHLETNSLSPEVYTIQIKNNSKFLLEGGNLSINLGNNAYFFDEPDSRDKTINIGALEPNQEVQIPVNLFFAGKTNQVTEIKTILDYLSPKKNQRFSIEKKISVSIRKPVFNFQTYFPKQVFVGEPFQISFRLSNITSQPLNLKIKIENPGNFEAISYSPPYEEFMMWDFGTFQPNSLSEIVVIGKFNKMPINPIFNVKPIVLFQGKEFTFNEIPVAVKAVNSPVVLEIKSYPPENFVSLQDNITYTINWENKSSINLNNATLKVIFDGPFDPGSIRTDGYYSAYENALVWNAQNNQKLYKISPGENGSVSFSIDVLRDYPIARSDSKDFALKVSAILETESIPPEIQILSPKLSISTDTTKILPGNISISSKVIYGDNALKNSGPFPLIPGNRTTATAHFYINTIAENFQNVMLKTKIPIGVKLTGIWGDNFIPGNLTYNQTTGDFFYQIKELPANLGTAYTPYDIVFQIEITPPVGDPRSFTILNDVSLSAQGKFSQKTFKGETRPITLYELTE